MATSLRWWKRHGFTHRLRWKLFRLQSVSTCEEAWASELYASDLEESMQRGLSPFQNPGSVSGKRIQEDMQNAIYIHHLSDNVTLNRRLLLLKHQPLEGN